MKKDPLQYEYIRFEKIEQKPKTSVWDCLNNSGDYSLGVIKWNPGWRQYCFFPGCDVVFSAGCLSDIIDFIAKLKAKEIT